MLSSDHASQSKALGRVCLRHRRKKDAEAVFLETSYWKVFHFEFSEGRFLFRPPGGFPHRHSRISEAEGGPSVCRRLVFMGGGSRLPCKAEMLFVSQYEEACNTVSSDLGSVVFVLSSLPIAFLCQALAIDDSLRNNEL